MVSIADLLYSATLSGTATNESHSMPINPLLSSALPRPQIKLPVDGIYMNDVVEEFLKTNHQNDPRKEDKSKHHRLQVPRARHLEGNVVKPRAVVGSLVQTLVTS